VDRHGRRRRENTQIILLISLPLSECFATAGRPITSKHRGDKRTEDVKVHKAYNTEKVSDIITSGELNKINPFNCVVNRFNNMS
jgi:hypothetical protein